MSKTLSQITVGDFVAQGNGDHNPHLVRVMRVTDVTITQFIVVDQDGQEVRFSRATGREIVPGGDGGLLAEPIRAASGRDMLNAARATAIRAVRDLGTSLDGSADEFDEAATRECFDTLARVMRGVSFAHTMHVVETAPPHDNEGGKA